MLLAALFFLGQLVLFGGVNDATQWARMDESVPREFQRK
jgi:hypothetical protein